MRADIGPRLLVGIPRRSRRRAPPLQSSASFAGRCLFLQCTACLGVSSQYAAFAAAVRASSTTCT
eukprot:5998964-Pyramimonas_sp.AAC.1